MLKKIKRAYVNLRDYVLLLRWLIGQRKEIERNRHVRNNQDADL